MFWHPRHTRVLFPRPSRPPPMKHLILLLSTLLLQDLTSAAQTVPFPLHPAGRAAVFDGLLLTPDLAGVADLLGHQSVRMDRVPLSDGSYVSLELERLSIERHKFGLHVDGVPAPGVIDPSGKFQGRAW